MTSVGLRELRQNTSSLLRKVEGGEEVAITVSGRVVAKLVPTVPKVWREWDAVAGLFSGVADRNWDRDLAAIDDDIGDRDSEG